MKLKFSILSAILLLIISCKQEAADKGQETVSTYYFIRHAEKVLTNPDNPNPDLTQEGYQRAQKWKEIFQEVPFDAVYSTDFIRTLQTAQPTAEANGLKVILYNHRDIDYSRFLNDTQGQTVLVVGHSNSTPNFVNKLIGKQLYEEIDEKEYGYLFIVKRIGNKLSADRLKINP